MASCAESKIRLVREAPVTVDVHWHCLIPDVMTGTPPLLSRAQTHQNVLLFGSRIWPRPKRACSMVVWWYGGGGGASCMPPRARAEWASATTDAQCNANAHGIGGASRETWIHAWIEDHPHLKLC